MALSLPKTKVYYSNFSSAFTVLFTTLLLMSSGSKGGLDNICISKDGMNFIDFDSSREICCEGATYDKHRYLCCNKKVVDIKNCFEDKHNCEKQICCGTKLVSEKNHLCCDNNLIELNDTLVKLRNDLRCCGKEYYINGDSKTCCGRSTIPLNSRIGCCGGVIYDRENSKMKCIAKKIIQPFEGVCNGEVYDKTASSCCGVKLNAKISELLEEQNAFFPNPAFDCCGEEVMDPQKNKCCPRNVHRFPSHSIPKDTHIQCCGHGYFDTSKELCINDTAVRMQWYNEQCGSHLIDSRTHGCCDNKLIYNKENEICCKGSHHCILPKDGACCNGYPLGNSEICCQGFKPCKKDQKDDDQCCFNHLTGRGRTYKSDNNQRCQRGKIVKERVGHYPCGPSTFYSANNEICCKNKIYQRKEGYVGCCGDRGLKQNEECCEEVEKLQNVGKKVQSVLIPCVKAKCGSHFINTATKSCCGNWFSYKISSKRKECCSGRELYDKRYSKCTKDGKVEPLKSHNGFCRSRLFDGAIGEACVRKNGIMGRIAKVRAQRMKSSTVVTIYLKRVRTILRQNDLPVPRSMVLSIQTKLKGKNLCLKYFKKNSKKFMIFFDEPVRKNQVEIFQQAPFFMTKYTRRRHKDLTNVVTKEFCQYYQNVTSWKT